MAVRINDQVVPRLAVLVLLATLAACSTTKSVATNGEIAANPDRAASPTPSTQAPTVAPVPPPTTAPDAGRADGVVASAPPWTAFRTFWFFYNRAELEESELGKIAEIARHAELHPTLEVGIDNGLDAMRAQTENREMNTRRIATIRDAMIKAGIAASRIQVGEFGDQRLAFDRRIAVLVRMVE